MAGFLGHGVGAVTLERNPPVAMVVHTEATEALEVVLHDVPAGRPG